MIIVCLIKMLYAIYISLSITRLSSDILLFTVSSPIYVLISSIAFIIFEKNKSIDKLLLFCGDIIYAISLFLCLFVNIYFIILTTITLIIDIVLAKRKKTVLTSYNKQNVFGYIWQVLFIALAFSVYYTSFELWEYAVFVAVCVGLFAIQTIFSVISYEIKRDKFKNIITLLLFYICIIGWNIPLFFSIRTQFGETVVKIDYMIYGLLIAVYPYAKILINISKKQKLNSR